MSWQGERATLHPTPYTLHPTPYTLHPPHHRQALQCRGRGTKTNFDENDYNQVWSSGGRRVGG